MVNDLTIDQMQGRISQLESELRALHIVEAMEHLRADQGWQRYESANKQLRQLEAQLAAQAVSVPCAWMAEDGRVQPVSAKETAERAGGAFAIAMRDYPIPLFRAAPAPDAEQENDRCAECGLHCKPSACIYGARQAGAMTDEHIHEIARNTGMYEQHDNARPNASTVEDFARAILAAAGAK